MNTHFHTPIAPADDTLLVYRRIRGWLKAHADKFVMRWAVTSRGGIALEGCFDPRRACRTSVLDQTFGRGCTCAGAACYDTYAERLVKGSIGWTLPELPVNPYAKGINMKLLQLTEAHGDVLMDLLMEIKDDTDANEGKGFFNEWDQRRIMSAFAAGRVFTLQFAACEEFARRSFLHFQVRSMFVRKSAGDRQYRASHPWVVPALCALAEGSEFADVLWVAPRARRNGYASKLVSALSLVKHPTSGFVTPEAKSFWKSRRTTH